jgi:hypothetical protein
LLTPADKESRLLNGEIVAIKSEGKWKKGEFESSDAIWEEATDFVSRQTTEEEMRTIRDLGNEYIAKGRYRVGERLLRRTWILADRILGHVAVFTLAVKSDLAAAIGYTGRYTEARDRFAELLPIQERVLGAEHPDTLITRGNLARWTGDAGDAAGARDRLAELLPILERVLGAEHPDTLRTRLNLARWTGNAGDGTNPPEKH